MIEIKKKTLKNLPLVGRTIVVTCSKEQSGFLCSQIRDLGAEPIEMPLVEVTTYCDPNTLEDVFAEISSYEWIVFTSVNGVKCFFDFFFKSFKDIRCIGGMRIACIGKSTAMEIEKFHLQVDLMSGESGAEDLAVSLMELQTLDNLKMLVVTGNMNRDVFVKELEEKGKAIIDILQVYETKLTDVTKEPAAKAFSKDGADAIVFTSSSIAKSFAKQAVNLQLDAKAKKPMSFSISPIISATMKEVGIPVDVEAKEDSIDGILYSLSKTFK